MLHQVAGPGPSCTPWAALPVIGPDGIEVVARNDLRAEPLLDLDQRAERNHVALLVADLQPADVLGLEAKLLIGLHAHLKHAAELLKSLT